ncbi:MAG: DJ-1 family glyoxalase III [Anaerovoracaceae bacterium]|nr:DJ-1/PfpI family protein [Clostridiales bacterium]
MVYVFLAEGFEEIEALTVVDVLRRGGTEVLTVSISDDLKVRGRSNISVMADKVIKEINVEKGEMAVLPGGQPGADNLLKSPELRKILLSYKEEGKYLAAICAAPMVLAEVGVLKGEEATIYPGMESYLKDSVALSDDVVVSSRIITSRGPALAMKFSVKLVEVLKGKAVADKVAEGLLL